MTGDRPPVWRMIKEVAAGLREPFTLAQIREGVLKRWPGVHEGTIACQVGCCTVNLQSRLSMPENSAPRHATGPYDFLFKGGRNEYYRFDPAKHGNWEIRMAHDGRLIVVQSSEASPIAPDSAPDATTFDESSRVADTSYTFPLEEHLQRFLVGDLCRVEPGLELYTDDEGNIGALYNTGEVGIIDILAKDAKGSLVVIELKAGRASDAALGQLQRYMGWVKKNLSHGKPVRGLIIAPEIGKRLKYGADVNPMIDVKTYKVSFILESADVEGEE